MKKSQEDYLETILTLSNEKDVVKSIDIANELNYSRASVSVAMKKLKEQELVNICDLGNITLTNQGKRKAEKVYEKHQVISSLLISLGISETTALEDACKIEHDISEETFSKIKEYFYKTKQEQK